MAPMSTSVDDPLLVPGKGDRSRSRLYPLDENPSLLSFQKLCSRRTDSHDYPFASSLSSKIPIYDLSQHDVDDAILVDSIQDEWNHVLLAGPGVLVLKSFLPDTALISQVNSVFSSIISSEAAANSGSKGDHFAAFAWLGPAYRITAQVNIVRPGGAPQVAHRDYHLGFQSAEACARFPKSMQIASQLLTLQGGVAHSDMALESGPTRFLPFSQMFEEGFMAYRLPEFQKYFDEHWVSLPLELGDAVFFNPALFHAAGENRTTNVERSANLLQISSAFGKTMERIDSLTILERCYGELSKIYESEGMSKRVSACMHAIAEGYPFPTNLDKIPPTAGGMAPESEVDVVVRGLEECWDVKTVVDQVKRLQADSMF